MMHVEALQWLNCIFTGRLRTNCHQLYELGNAKHAPLREGLHRPLRAPPFRAFCVHGAQPVFRNNNVSPMNN